MGGLISEISKHESLMEDANALASEIVKQPPDALRMAKNFLEKELQIVSILCLRCQQICKL